MVTIRNNLSTTPQTLKTDRLELRALARAELAYLHTGVRAFEAALGLKLAPGLLTDSERRAVARKLAQMQAAPEHQHPWFTYWLAMDRASGRGIGLVGFKGPPDAKGSVEIAYSIAPSQQGRGFATEAAGTLIAWAFQHTACRAVMAPDTPRSNAASSRVLEKLGMRVYAVTERAQSWRLERTDSVGPPHRIRLTPHSYQRLSKA